jgi:hypothetical protein
MIVPALLNGVLYCGVFDGHAEEGGIVAERAAQTLGNELASALQWLVHVCLLCIYLNTHIHTKIHTHTHTHTQPYFLHVLVYTHTHKNTHT